MPVARSAALQAATPANVSVKIIAKRHEKELHITNLLAVPDKSIPRASFVRVRGKAKVTVFRPNPRRLVSWARLNRFNLIHPLQNQGMRECSARILLGILSVVRGATTTLGTGMKLLDQSADVRIGLSSILRLGGIHKRSGGSSPLCSRANHLVSSIGTQDSPLVRL
jgi:hypothetical protein